MCVYVCIKQAALKQVHDHNAENHKEVEEKITLSSTLPLRTHAGIISYVDICKPCCITGSLLYVNRWTHNIANMCNLLQKYLMA